MQSKRQASAQDGTPAPRAVPDYYKQYLDGKWRYVELALVSDHALVSSHYPLSLSHPPLPSLKSTRFSLLPHADRK